MGRESPRSTPPHRLGVWDDEKEVAYETVSLGALRSGFRCLHLRNRFGTRIDMCHMFVHIELGTEPHVWAEAEELRQHVRDQQQTILQQQNSIDAQARQLARCAAIVRELEAEAAARKRPALIAATQGGGQERGANGLRHPSLADVTVAHSEALRVGQHSGGNGVLPVDAARVGGASDVKHDATDLAKVAEEDRARAKVVEEDRQVEPKVVGRTYPWIGVHPDESTGSEADDDDDKNTAGRKASLWI